MNHESESLLDTLAATQNTHRNMLHELETSDVSISREALAALGKAARALMAKVMGNPGSDELSLGDIVKIFASRIFWNEAGGELIMCADLGGRTVCLPIPAEHWSVNVDGQLQ